jgi:phosphate transport system protein
MTQAAATITAVERIEQDLLKMAALAEDTMKKGIQALRDQDMDLAHKVIEQDDKIDNLQIVVEEELERIGAEAPASAFSLRRQFATLKIAGNLERIGDYATNIAEVVLELKREPHIKPLVHIPQLAALTMSMVSTVIRAFVNKDADLADAVCRKDEEADNLYTLICDELVRIIGVEADPQKAYQATRFLLIAEWLERAADHTTNIGEETIYIVTGKRVKY